MPNAVTEIFSFEGHLRRVLRFEKELALAEARHGMIPQQAADDIAAAADSGRVDTARVKADLIRLRHPMVPYVDALAEASGPSGEYVHWGATTQDVIDVSRVLALKEVAELLSAQIDRVLLALRKLALDHRATLMAGRTVGQHATPITFGGKVAVWADELLREEELFWRASDVVFAGQFGGAAGQLGSVGAVGLAVRDELCDALGLARPRATWHTARDRIQRVMFHCAVLSGTGGRIGEELSNLQRTEISEVGEAYGHDEVSSSAMPHKRNPKDAGMLASLATLVMSDFGLAMSTWRGDHERDGLQFGMEGNFVGPIAERTLDSMIVLERVMSSLTVYPERMRENLYANGRQAWSEILFYDLARTLGRTSAHHLMHEATSNWRPGDDIFELVARDSTLSAGASGSEPSAAAIELLLGASAAAVDRVIDAIDARLGD